MKTNICVYGLTEDYVKKIAKRVSNKFEMFFADVDALIEFDLINTQMVEEVCGKEYLEKLERKKVKNTATFENTLLSLRFSLINDELNRKVLDENCLMVYIKLNQESYEKKLSKGKKEKLNRILSLAVFEERNRLLESYADVVVECSGLNVYGATNKVIDKIYEHYEV